MRDVLNWIGRHIIGSIVGLIKIVPVMVWAVVLVEFVLLAMVAGLETWKAVAFLIQFPASLYVILGRYK